MLYGAEIWVCNRSLEQTQLKSPTNVLQSWNIAFNFSFGRDEDLTSKMAG